MPDTFRSLSSSERPGRALPRLVPASGLRLFLPVRPGLPLLSDVAPSVSARPLGAYAQRLLSASGAQLLPAASVPLAFSALQSVVFLLQLFASLRPASASLPQRPCVALPWLPPPPLSGQLP